MLSDEVVNELEQHVQACDEARSALEDALDRAASAGSQDDATLEEVARALHTWRTAQERFMETVAKSDVSNVPMAALLLQKHEEIDASNARRGLPGASVEGADQPFDIDLSGQRGSILTTAAMDYLPDLDE
jgi:hypothetical protein